MGKLSYNDTACINIGTGNVGKVGSDGIVVSKLSYEGTAGNSIIII